MKLINKYWKSSLQKAQVPKNRRVTSVCDCVERKIRMVEIQIKSAFERESKLFLSQFHKPDCFSSTRCTEYICEAMKRHSEVLYMNGIKNYIQLCVLNYFSSLNLVQNATSKMNKRFIKLQIDKNILEEMRENIAEFILSFYEEKERFEEYLTQTIKDGKESVIQIAEYIKNGWQHLTNYGYQLKVKGKLKSIKRSGRSQYSYICENSGSSCEVCIGMDGQIFNIEEAETGKNLPPMHPNCRCSINAYPALTELPEVPEFLQDTPVEYLLDVVESAVQQIEGKIDDLADDIGGIWTFFFKKVLEDTYGTYTTIVVDGVEYRINMASFKSVAIMPDGSYLVPELVSEVDEQMLALMKERDSLAEGDPRIEELNAELSAIYELANEEERHVYWRKPYSFYSFGGDVTDRLNEYMKNTSSDYADMHDRYWADNLADFYELVRNRGKMDLKNQPEWQNSAFIYDGEIVSQDALGNINYGYFGKHCNFPDSVLIAAGGVAQFIAGNSEIDNWYVFLDDPRDTYRVMQGIEIYKEEN